METNELATPCLVIDAEITRRNIRRMQKYVNEHSLKLRPHTKTHKSIPVGRLQIEEGACGLTVAKAGEAQVMAEAAPEILMAYPPVTQPRCEQLALLAQRTGVLVAVDSLLAAERLDQAALQAGSRIGMLVDIDIGYGRTGVTSDDAALHLGRAIDRLGSLDLRGVMIYSGHITGPADQQIPAMQQLQERLEGLAHRWDENGLSREIISSGSTPSAVFSHHVPLLTEIRPGTYVYNDMNIVRGGYDTLENCAARVHTTVISNSVADQIVIDAGSKTLTSDRCGPAPDSGHGYILEYPEAKVFRLTEEHGQVDVSKCHSQPELGERLTVIPNHICVCVNMQNSIWWVDGDQTECRPVDGRGLLV